MNVLIGGIIIAAIGIAYGWLGIKKRDRGRQISEIRRDINEMNRRIEAQKARMDSCLGDKPLEKQVSTMGLNLRKIGPGELHTVSLHDLTDRINK